MSMRHHWHELDELLRELDEAARFTRERPRLRALAARDGEAGGPAGEAPREAPAPVVPIRPALRGGAG